MRDRSAATDKPFLVRETTPAPAGARQRIASISRRVKMPMIDVYSATGTFADKHALAQDLAAAVMRWEKVPELSLFRKNTAAFVHDLPVDSLSNVDGDS